MYMDSNTQYFKDDHFTQIEIDIISFIIPVGIIYIEIYMLKLKSILKCTQPKIAKINLNKNSKVGTTFIELATDRER